MPFKSQKCTSGFPCLVALYDEGEVDAVTLIDSESGSKSHSARIASVKVTSEGRRLTDISRVIGVDFEYCMRAGYDKVKQKLIEAHGHIPIEAHAYSRIESMSLERFHRQFSSILDSSELRSFILCSPGHTLGLMRFPATVPGVHSVGLLRSDGTVVGAGVEGNLQPTFLVNDQFFVSCVEQGSEEHICGTSPAVAWVAGLAALVVTQLGSDPALIYSALVMASTQYKGSNLISAAYLLEKPLRSLVITKRRTRHRRLMAMLTRLPGDVAKFSVVATVRNYSGWAGTPVGIRIQIDECPLISDSGSHVLDLGDFSDGQDIRITIVLDGLCDDIGIVAVGLECKLLEDMSQPPKSDADQVIVGVSASHDASACVMVNGKIKSAIQNERISRRKRDGAGFLNSDLAIAYCLEDCGLALEDVDYFAYNIQSLTPEYVGLSQPLRQGMQSFDPLGENSLFASHHLCHAFAGLSGSGYRDATVVVADGSGGTTQGESDLILNGFEMVNYLAAGLADKERPLLHTFSVYDFTSDGYQLTHREYSPSFNTRAGSKSLGETYAAVSQYVFGSWQASGKLMGLAPYGDPQSVIDLTEVDELGVCNFSFSWKMMYSEKVNETNQMACADLAAAVQSGLEAGLESRFARYVNPQRNLVFTGGLALNSVANHKLRKKFGLQNFYLFPAQHDAGVSIGAACAAAFYVNKKIPERAYENEHLGHVYSRHDLYRALNLYARVVRVESVTSQDLARNMARGEIYGFFSLEKGSEFGPRALGARSILADPRSRDTWSLINRWIKFREDFRPFAPMVAEEHLSQFFKAEGVFPHMLEVVDVNPDYASVLQAVTHVDCTARVQTVSCENNPRLHALLENFMGESGVPILLNTSFNVRGQPMVETPIHAIEMLLCTHLSGVVFDDLLVTLRHDGREFNKSAVLGLSPGTSVLLERTVQGPRRQLIVGHQGKRHLLPEKLAEILIKLDGERSLQDLLLGFSSVDIEWALKRLNQFVRLRYLLVHSDPVVS